MIKSMVYSNSKTYWNIQDNEKNIYTSLKADLIDHKHTKSKVSCVQKLCLSVSTAKKLWWILRSQVKCIFWWNDETYSTMNWNC